MRLWQIAVVVAAGLAFGLIEPGKLTYAFGHATLYVFLPALLFEAAWNLNYRAMRRHWGSIALLVGPGVALTAIVIAGALSVVQVRFGTALLTGAILSATDPIAVVAVFRRLKVPASLATIVECESLFNDAVAVVLYRAVIVALAAGPQAGEIARVTLLSLGGAIGGVVLGVVVAFLAARALRSSKSVTVQIAVTVVCAYGTYFLGDFLDLSGIFATIACGIALRYFERAWITLRIVDDVEKFWDLCALFANVLVFFLVGAALHISSAVRDPVFVVATLVGLVVSRIAVGGLLLPTKLPREWLDVVRVAGMRGGLSLALALAIPQWVPDRSTIIDATFAAVLATIAAGTLTIVPTVQRVARRRSPVRRPLPEREVVGDRPDGIGG
ncbi:MAG: cation:proton antiporter [Vulcanimicrobiaceae bacterium]